MKTHVVEANLIKDNLFREKLICVLCLQMTQCFLLTAPQTGFNIQPSWLLFALGMYRFVFNHTRVYQIQLFTL